MPDAMDRVQQYADDLNADALAQHARRPVQTGRMDCGEPILPARTALGALLCMECQRAEEARAAHFSTWRRR
jgi:RNA polymerase-binding transcription factor DksA